MLRYFPIFFFFFSCFAMGQNVDADAKFEKRSNKNWDSTKYQKFERVLILGLFQQYRTFNNEFNVRPPDSLSKHVYSAESNLTGGIVFSFDKFQFSLATRNNPSNVGEGKGYTKMFNLGLNVGDNRWVSETYFRKFKGFYNRNVSIKDTTKVPAVTYYLQPGLLNRTFMQRFMYFTNYKKYSYKSGFGCNYRQLKSAGTFILGASFNIFDLKNDSAILPLKARAAWGEYGSMKGFTAVNLGVNGGFALTIVLWKALFMAAHGTIGPELQRRHYYLSNANHKLSYISFSGTVRGSLGINMKKFYMLYSLTNDYNSYDQTSRTFSSNSLTNNFTFGWRFHCKTPKFYESFMKTKWYNVL